MEKKLLIVEDDNEINHLIKDYFELKNFSVRQAFSGTEALLLAEQFLFDVVILDLMLPGKNGEEIISCLKEKQDIPIIVITAKDKTEASIATLKLGADDFLAKPFNIEELFLRVKKLLQMYQRIHVLDPDNSLLQFKDITISEAERSVWINEALLKLTAKEFEILTLFVRSPHQVFTKEKILELVWQDEVGVDTNSVAVHVSNLRKKLGTAATIKTVWGIGFKIEESL